MFDQNTLTIGFARRFTSYKRPELIFSDPDRLARILNAGAVRCRSSSRGRRIRPTKSASTICSACTKARLDPKFGGRIAFVDDLRPARGAFHGAGV
jgi:glucan phosphorylase